MLGDGKFLPLSSHVLLREFLFLVFHSNSKHFNGYFRLDLPSHCILGIIRKSDLFLLPNVSIRDANFGQR